MRYLALFACLILLGCNGCAGALAHPAPGVPPAAGIVTQYVPVWIDSKFSDKEKGDIRAALEAWDTTLNGYSEFIVVSDQLPRPADDAAVSIRRLLSKEGLTFNREEMTPEYIESPELAHYDPESNDIFVLSDRIGFRDLRVIVMHEVGHFFISPPIGHVLIRGSLMYWAYDFQPACVDQVTAMYVGEIQKWDWHHMAYCVIP